MKSMTFRLTIGISLCTLLLIMFDGVPSAATLTQNPWPMFHHDGQLSGQTSAVGPAMPLIQWTYNTGSPFSNNVSSVISTDGTVYFGSTCCGSQTVFFALNANGTVKWVFQAPGVFASAPALSNDGIVYIGSTSGMLYAFYPDGSLKWSRDMGSAVIEAVIVSPDGTLYVPTSNALIVALNPDGTLKWDFQSPMPRDINQGGPAVLALDGTIYVSDRKQYLYALTPNGTLKWQLDPGTGQGLAPTVIGADETIYVARYGGVVYAIRADGSYKWSYGTGETNITGAPAVATDGTIYVGTSGISGPVFGYLFAINSDGTLKWKLPNPNIGYLNSSPIIDGAGTIYITGDSQPLLAVRPDGTVKWQIGTGGVMAPTMGADGTIYVMYSGYIAAISEANQPPSVEAGGPYSVSEGGSIFITALGNDPEGGPLIYEWDLDNNNSFETFGETIVFPAMSLSAPSTHIVTVRVTDNGGLSATDLPRFLRADKMRVSRV